LRESTEQIIQNTKSALSARREDITGNLRSLLEEVEASLEKRKNEMRRTIDDAFESISDRPEDREPTRERLNEFAEEIARKIDGEVLVDQPVEYLNTVADAAASDLTSGVGLAFEELFEASITVE